VSEGSPILPNDGPTIPTAGRPNGPPARFAITIARFYEDLAERLLASAREAFAQAGHEVETFDVPGAYELPLAAAYAARSGRYDGVACLGAVIRGETDHYDFVCGEAARGIMQVQLDTGVPCAFGVLTCDTMEQALARSGGGKRDQGRHAAEAVMALAALRRELEAGTAGSASEAPGDRRERPREQVG
jgi:6,7-dimethyl-8-ribityllumazine synthase